MDDPFVSLDIAQQHGQRHRVRWEAGALHDLHDDRCGCGIPDPRHGQIGPARPMQPLIKERLERTPRPVFKGATQVVGDRRAMTVLPLIVA